MSVLPELNPPVWELGHIGWFQEHWVARNLQRSHEELAAHVTPEASAVLDLSTLPTTRPLRQRRRNR